MRYHFLFLFLSFFWGIFGKCHGKARWLLRAFKLYSRCDVAMPHMCSMMFLTLCCACLPRSMGPTIVIGRSPDGSHLIYISHGAHMRISIESMLHTTSVCILVEGELPIWKLLPLSSICIHGRGGLFSAAATVFRSQTKSTAPPCIL